MSSIAELIFEIVFSFSFEFSIDILTSNRVRTWVKIPVFIIFFITSSILPAIFLWIAFLHYNSDSTFLALVFASCALVYYYVVYRAFRQKILQRKSKVKR